jgi:hypothetical protein
MNNSGLASPFSTANEKPGQPIRDWGDLFVRRTSCYMRTVVTVDLAFCKGKFPEEYDFPLNLRSDKLSAVLPLYRMERDGIAETTVREVGEPRTSSHEPSRHNQSVPAREGTAMLDSALDYFRDVATPVMGTADVGYHMDSASSAAGDHAFTASKDISAASFGDGMFDIESWIYDLLPNIV